MLLLLHSTEKSLPAPIGFCSASHHMTLDKSVSLSNLQIFKLWNKEVRSDYSYGSIRTQTQSFNGWVSPDFQVLAHLNDAEPPTHTPEKKYPSPPPSTDEFIAGSTEGLSPHLPRDQAQGWILYMLYLISPLKTPWRVSITLPNFYMKKLRLWEVNGCLGQMD